MILALCLAALVSGQTVDTLSTARLLRQPGYHEANPLMPSTLGGIVAVKAAVTGAVVLTAWTLRRRHPRWAVALCLIGAASGTFSAVHNAQVR